MRPAALLAALLLPALAWAQEAGQTAPAFDPEAFVLADRLLSNGQVEAAVPILEDLYAADPASTAVRLKLAEAYTEARQFDALVQLADAHIGREGPSVDRLAARGVALHRAGRTAEAEAAWDAAVAHAPREAQTYRHVANEVASLRLFSEAAAVLDRGRQQLGDDDLFLLERAHLYGLALDYEAAVEAYLQLLARDPDYVPAVRSRLTRLLTGQGAPEAFARAVDRATALDPLNRAYRELASWLALERGDYDAALDAVRALDRLEREEGQTLLSFAQEAAAAGAPEAAARALDEVLERHASGPVAFTARLARARLADEQAREARESSDRGPTPFADAARAGYLAFLDNAPGSAQAPAVALALADLLRDVHRDFEAAEQHLGVAAEARDPDVSARARLALGEVAVRRGDLDAARERFAAVDEGIQIGPLAEQARYELALLDFYEGFMFSALARAEAIDENTAAEASNDAISLRVTLSESLDMSAPPDSATAGGPLQTYARAVLLHRRGLLDPALATLDSLDAQLDRGDLLGDESLYLRASALRQRGEAEAAVATLDALAERHPLSFFRDRALRFQAQVLERELGDAAAAAGRYDRLLELFPGSLYAPEARLELRRLRSAGLQ